MKKITIILLAVIFTSCKTNEFSKFTVENFQSGLSVYFYYLTKEDQIFKDYMIKNEDKEFDNKSLFTIFNVSNNDRFSILENDVKVLNNKSLSRRKSSPIRFYLEMNRKKSYDLIINDTIDYKITPQILNKYKFVYLEKPYSQKNYHLTFTNYRRRYR